MTFHRHLPLRRRQSATCVTDENLRFAVDFRDRNRMAQPIIIGNAVGDGFRVVLAAAERSGCEQQSGNEHASLAHRDDWFT